MSADATPGEAVTVRQSVFVELGADDAFRLFTDGIGQWWPLDEGFSYGGDRAREIFLEPREGGRFYERFIDGDELQVGTVIACTPPRNIVFTWRSPDWRAETEVEVTFVAGDRGTTVEVEHRGFDRLGPDGAAIAQRWVGGWPRVVRAYADTANRGGTGLSAE